MGLLSILGSPTGCGKSKLLDADYARYRRSQSQDSSSQTGNPALAQSALSVLTQGSGATLKDLGLGGVDINKLFLPSLSGH